MKLSSIRYNFENIVSKYVYANSPLLSPHMHAYDGKLSNPKIIQLSKCRTVTAICTFIRVRFFSYNRW